MKYTYLVIAGFLFNILTSWYFGWNMEASSPAEVVTDNISLVMIIWGVIGDVLKNVTWQKSTHISVLKEDLRDTIDSI
jgi:hypothetical protein